MTPGFAARRRAEEFDSLVEGASTGERRATEYAELLEVVGALRGAPTVEPRPEFVADLRHQLMAEAATVLTPTTAKLTLAPRRTRRERRLAIAVGGFAVVSATTSMAVAAQGALPGDTLYPLKRALENASTTIRADEDAKGTTILAHASGRLEEVDKLTRRNDDPDAEAVADTLHVFSDQATMASDLLVAAYEDGGDREAIDRLRDFTGDSMEKLTDLESAVPEPARAALIEAAQVVNLIDTQALQLCPSCGNGVTEVPDFATTAAEFPALLDDLGVPLAAPDLAPPSHTADAKPPKAGDDTKETGQAPLETDDILPIVPGDDPTQSPGTSSGSGDGSGDTKRDNNIVKNLTEGLTGSGDDSTSTEDQSLTEFLGGTLEDVVGGLLGGSGS